MLNTHCSLKETCPLHKTSLITQPRWKSSREINMDASLILHHRTKIYSEEINSIFYYKKDIFFQFLSKSRIRRLAITINKIRCVVECGISDS